jgi:hypothetical protein
MADPGDGENRLRLGYAFHPDRLTRLQCTRVHYFNLHPPGDQDLAGGSLRHQARRDVDLLTQHRVAAPGLAPIGPHAQGPQADAHL